MKMIQKAGALSLAGLLMLGAMISCGDEAEPAKPAETDAKKTTETELTTEAEKEPDYFDQIVLEADGEFVGETIHILTMHYYSRPTLPMEQTTGEPVNDALFERNQKIEEKLGITLDFHTEDDRTAVNRVTQKFIQAGDSTYDFIINALAVDALGSVAPRGFLRNLYDIPVIQLDKPWWNASCRENLTFFDKLYLTAGPISLQYYHSPNVVTFNKRICDNYDVGDLYQVVLDGEWTIDRIAQISKGVTSDLNSDGKMDENDLWAFSCDGATGSALFVGCGGKEIVSDAEGNPVFNLESEETVRIIDRLQEVFDSNVLYRAENFSNPGDVIDNRTRGFKYGHCMFFSFMLNGVINDLRDMDDDYGILPMPKFDTAQKDYITFASPYLPSGAAVPVTCDDDREAFVGTVMESMAYLGYTMVGPKMVDIVLKEKIARDENSQLMLDIIFNNMVFDMNCLHNFANTGDVVQNAALSAEKNYVSKCQKYMKTAQKKLDEMIEHYMELN